MTDESNKTDPKKTGPKEARVLVDCEFGNCGDVVKLSAQEIKRGEESNCIDSNPEAVKYAKAQIAKEKAKANTKEVVHEE